MCKRIETLHVCKHSASKDEACDKASRFVSGPLCRIYPEDVEQKKTHNFYAACQKALKEIIHTYRENIVTGDGKYDENVRKLVMYGASIHHLLGRESKEDEGSEEMWTIRESMRNSRDHLRGNWGRRMSTPAYGVWTGGAGGVAPYGSYGGGAAPGMALGGSVAVYGGVYENQGVGGAYGKGYGSQPGGGGYRGFGTQRNYGGYGGYGNFASYGGR